MKVGVLTNSLSRRGGGIFWVVCALSQGLRDAGCAIRVFAPQDEDTAVDLPCWGAVEVAALPVRGPAAFGYLPGLHTALRAMNPELLHVHGMWGYRTIAALQWSKKASKLYIVSPHGTLDVWALNHSGWKKRLAAGLYQKRFLRQAACFHALNPSELQSIRTLGLSNPVAVIPNGVELPEPGLTPPAPQWAAALPAESRVLLFLSRLHPKKGLVNLLHGWAGALGCHTDGSASWRLVIAGWDQGGHQAVLEGLARDLGVADRVSFVGPQFDEDKAASLNRADAFVLPSFSEGLPMAVLEAWAYRLPVLMTPQCNLPEGFAAGAALAIEPEADSIGAGLNALFAMDASALMAMGERGRQLVESRFTWSKVAAEMYAVYQWVLGHGEKPDCVNDEGAG